jgi:hypothetical protein
VGSNPTALTQVNKPNKQKEVQMITITSEIVTITPDMALEILDGHENWRKLRPSRVIQYAASMSRGEWSLTGEAIKFDSDGNLLDGQHRLAACMEAEVPFTTLVVRGVPEESVEYMDNVLVRTETDTLSNRGITSASSLKAIAKRILMWKTNSFGNTHRMAELTHKQVVDFVIANEEELRHCLRIANRMKNSSGINPTMAASFAFMAGEQSKVERDLFCEMFASGAGLEDGSPVLAMRQWVTNRVFKKMKISDEEIARVLTKAWNHFREGNTVSRIKSDSGYKKKRGGNRPPMEDFI